MTDSPYSLTEEESFKQKLKPYIRIAALVAFGALGLFGAWLAFWPDDDALEEVDPEPARQQIAAARQPNLSAQAGRESESSSVASQSSEQEPTDEYREEMIESSSESEDATDDEAVNAIFNRSSQLDLRQLDILEEQRSRLLDAMHASPVVAVEEIAETESDDASPSDAGNGKFSLTPGSVIPAVLVQTLRSDLPGMAVAHVSRDVYDSKRGRTLLIPRGTRISGDYDFSGSASDRRLNVNWRRLDFPNGGSLSLDKVLGVDQSGAAGVEDQIKRGATKALGITALTSLISGTLAYAAESRDPETFEQTPDGRLVARSSLGESVGEDVARQFGEIATDIAKDHLQRGALLTIRSGLEFNVQITKALSLPAYSS